MKKKEILVRIKDIYEALIARRLIRTKSDFSSNWLCMHWSYYSIMGEGLTMPALLSLWEMLQAAGQTDLAIKVFALVRDRTVKTPMPQRGSQAKVQTVPGRKPS